MQSTGYFVRYVRLTILSYMICIICIAFQLLLQYQEYCINVFNVTVDLWRNNARTQFFLFTMHLFIQGMYIMPRSTRKYCSDFCSFCWSHCRCVCVMCNGSQLKNRGQTWQNSPIVFRTRTIYILMQHTHALRPNIKMPSIIWKSLLLNVSNKFINAKSYIIRIEMYI